MSDQYPYGPPPEPQHKKKGGCLRWVGIAAVVFVALIVAGSIIAVAAGGGDDDVTGSAGDVGRAVISTSTTPSDPTETADEGPQTNSGNTENPPTEDVELTECGPRRR